MNPRYWLRFLSLLCVAAAVMCRAQARDDAAEHEIEGNLARIDAALVPDFHGATLAFDTQKYQIAAGLYEKVLAKAPQFTPAMRRLGSCKVMLGAGQEGLELCERAVAIERSAENLETLATDLLRAAGDSAPDSTVERAVNLLEEARRKPNGDDPDTLAMLAQNELHLNRRYEANVVLNHLLEKFPNAPGGYYVKGIMAAIDGRWLTAESSMKKARRLGLKEPADAFLANPTVSSKIRETKIAWLCAIVIGGWLLGLLTLYLSGAVLSKVTLAAIHPAEPGQATLRPAEHRLRRLYRAVINIAGIYYYISIPVILVLVIGIAAGVIWLMLASGFVSLKLFLILGIGAIMTIWAVVKSLLLRKTAPEPGRPLAREEAPGLWALAEEAAQALGTRPIDEIRLTTGTDVAVYERGTWRAKLRDEAKRVLLLGTAVLPGFRQDEFLCVLAHEYGHFSHRDTAGGEIALRVRSDMIRFYIQMRAAGQATYYNVAFHFLRAYNFIFRRISHGATRLQEVLADRVAAQAYGSAALEGGLRHVIRRGVEFNHLADVEIRKSIASRSEIPNIYQMATSASPDVESNIDKAMQRPTTADDTHPGPNERFRLIAGLPRTTGPARSDDVWGLIVDRDVIMKEMLGNLEKLIERHRG